MQISLVISLLAITIGLTTLQSCDKEVHNVPDHPCNFPDVETLNNLLSPRSYMIIDKETNINLVDTSQTTQIHPDSVKLYNAQFNELPKSYRYSVDAWIFENLTPYIGMDVPFNDPQSYVNLTSRTFYLTTSNSDVDTIQISFESCLVKEVLFNGTPTHPPTNDPYIGWASFYFKK